MARLLRKAALVILKWFVKQTLFLAVLCFAFYIWLIYTGLGISECGGALELRSLKYAAEHGGIPHAWELLNTMTMGDTLHDCYYSYQIDTLESIMARQPRDTDEKEKMIEFAVKEILKPCQSQINRTQFIQALEVISGESFESSGYPMHGWLMKNLSEEEQESARQGLEYIREWWEKRQKDKPEAPAPRNSDAPASQT